MGYSPTPDHRPDDRAGPGHLTGRHAERLPVRFRRALTLHRLGQPAEAEAGYRQVLKKRPNHFDALRRLGVCEHQSGNSEAADQPFGTDVSGFGPAAPCPCCSRVLKPVHARRSLRRRHGGAAAHARHQFGRRPDDFSDHLDRLTDRIEAAAEPGHAGRIALVGLIDSDLKCYVASGRLRELLDSVVAASSGARGCQSLI